MKVLWFFIIMVSLPCFLNCDKDDGIDGAEPRGWFLTGSHPQDYRIGTDDMNSHNGTRSGYIESISDSIAGFGTLMSFCDGEIFKGERIKLTGYVQTQAPESSFVQMWVRVDDYDLRVTADFDNMGDRPMTGTWFWTKCVIVFDVPESQCVINYGLLLLFTGKAWFDDLSFEVVDSSTSKTAININEPFPEGMGQFPENLTDNPLNLDFEE